MTAYAPVLAPATGRHPAGAGHVSMRWAALTEAGQVVAMLAGKTVGKAGSEIRNFPALLRETDSWRQEAADRALTDLSAIMEPGLAALLAINARGNDCRAAAESLWTEFSEARAALLSMLPPSGAMGPKRSA